MKETKIFNGKTYTLSDKNLTLGTKNNIIEIIKKRFKYKSYRTVKQPNGRYSIYSIPKDRTKHVRRLK